MKAVVAAFNQEKALVGAFSVITNLRMELFGALVETHINLNTSPLASEGRGSPVPRLSCVMARDGDGKVIVCLTENSLMHENNQISLCPQHRGLASDWWLSAVRLQPPV